MLLILLTQMVCSSQVQTHHTFSEKPIVPLLNEDTQYKPVYERKTYSTSQSDTLFQPQSTSELNGGAAEVQSSAAFTFTNCKFLRCSSSKYGGAVYAAFPSGSYSLTFRSCIFEYCSALSGGAIYTYGLNQRFQCILQNCNFESNTATSNAKLTFSLSGSSASIKEEHGGGGALFLGMKSGNMKECIFQNNQCSNGYGSNILHAGYSTGTGNGYSYSTCTFYYSDSTSSSSFFYVDSKSTSFAITFSNCHFYNLFELDSNTQHHFSTDQTGTDAITLNFNQNCFYSKYCTDSNALKNEFSSLETHYEPNSANCPEPEYPPNGDTEEPKELTCSSDSDLQNKFVAKQISVITGCQFSKLISIEEDGGAIYSEDFEINISDCSFGQCTAKQGGAISFIYYEKQCTNYLTNCIFSRCRSTCGGAIYDGTVVESAIVIDSCQFESNSACDLSQQDAAETTSGNEYRGGAIYLYHNSAEIKNCTFSNNLGTNGCNIYLDLDSSSEIVIDNCSIQFSQDSEKVLSCSSSIYFSMDENLVANPKIVLRNSTIINSFSNSNEVEGNLQYHFQSNNLNFEFDSFENNCVDKEQGETALSPESLNVQIDSCSDDGKSSGIEENSSNSDEEENGGNSSDSINSDEEENGGNSSDSINSDEEGKSGNSLNDEEQEGGDPTNPSDSISDDEEPEEGGKPTNPSGNEAGGNSGNKGFPTYAIGIIVGILVIVLALIILIVILKKRRTQHHPEEDSQIDDDKDCEMSMSRVSLESNLDHNEQDVDNFSDVEEIDPFKQSIDEYNPKRS